MVRRLDGHLNVVRVTFLEPADVIRTKRPFACNCAMESAPLYPIAARSPPIS